MNENFLIILMKLKQTLGIYIWGRCGDMGRLKIQTGSTSQEIRIQQVGLSSQHLTERKIQTKDRSRHICVNTRRGAQASLAAGTDTGKLRELWFGPVSHARMKPSC